MKKVLIVILVLIIGGVGFLAYDWYSKTQQSQPRESMPLYSWTDEKGTIHYSDTPPPRGAKNIKTTKGYKHVQLPWIFIIKEKALQSYKNVKRKIFRSEEDKKPPSKS